MRWLTTAKKITLFFVAIVFNVSLFSTSCSASGSGYFRRVDNADTVIIFVHGVLGDAKQTWTAPNGVYWPDLLAKDNFYNGMSIYTYEYPSSIFRGNFSIDEISENMRLYFDSDGISAYKNIIFLAHSMGGLVTRAYILKNRDISEKVKFAYFYSTPTTGSELASLASLLSNNPQLSKMKSMQSADYLADLQRQWLSARYNIPSYCAYETQSTFKINVVTQASASNLCNRRLDPINADHISIVKPESIRNASYMAFKLAMSENLNTFHRSNNIIGKSEKKINIKKLNDIQGFLDNDYKNTPATAFIFTKIKFQDDDYNKMAYFNSLDKIGASLELNSGELLSVPAKIAECAKPQEEWNCLISLEFKAQPALGSNLKIIIGAFTAEQSVTESTFSWEAIRFSKYEEPGRTWSVAISEVYYEIARPTWLVLSDAELLSGSDNNSLLRVTISNQTDNKKSIRHVILSASAPFESGIQCNTGDPTQKIILKWELIHKKKLEAISTELHGVELPVDTMYNFDGICSGARSIVAKVPVAETISAHESKDIYLKIKELPPITHRTRRRTLSEFDFRPLHSGFAIPSTLTSWPNLWLSAEPDSTVALRPLRVEVRKTFLQSKRER